MHDSHDVEQAVAEHHGDDAGDDADAGHVLLLHQVGGVGQGVGWRGDGQNQYQSN